ncbi:HypC/HybG/HupF family hydrogenase formation chaperone [Candidatus Methanomassiliicoccus intestinalis]|jgi:hydrogenase assembly chaperone hypC/hupF|uniref:[NiFe] hydrogenase metallocenter assembly protein HypC n=2 Tax=Candidatus Methanomassiliicoccus intestinalis TaxID=1406512 RepID=R9T5E9_METII|nr:HypC/HybG/HupF family hydrogenase formation chaperone [Candidatus Methanomassiliicoccus intestinalis]AGN25769.1 [NiFe] hydrogenase metallocenter assembly protein HypC [Candidatus Methanomassiliicoccus intestinalis Issoire-Mx1]TQS82723.1 MAG: hydrogenase assembly protein HypC [Candidatus Methanomassiliicoccus intestinalis]TQS84119.1 MAG: hydrogenase assembly protein HypC [Candidatus Methanomassiliicoccus intestinalis]
MCLAVPGQIVSIEGPQADVDFGGVLKKVNVSLIEGHVGDWVVVHAGFAIETMDEEEAQETLQTWKELLEMEEELEKSN